jgi:hypothetical protein
MADFIRFPCPAARITAAVELIKKPVTSRVERVGRFLLYFSPTDSKNPFMIEKQKKGAGKPLRGLAVASGPGWNLE